MAAKAKVLLRSIVPNRSFKMAWKGLQSVMSFSQPIVLIGGVDNFFIYAYIAEALQKELISGAPNEKIVQNHLNIALLNVF